MLATVEGERLVDRFRFNAAPGSGDGDLDETLWPLDRLSGERSRDGMLSNNADFEETESFAGECDCWMAAGIVGRSASRAVDCLAQLPSTGHVSPDRAGQVERCEVEKVTVEDVAVVKQTVAYR